MFDRVLRSLVADRRSRRRLADAIAAYEPGLKERIRTGARDRETADGGDAAAGGKTADRSKIANGSKAALGRKIAEQYLERAREACEQWKVDEGWSCFLEAQRAEVQDFERHELEARMIAVHAEAKQKLKKWRHEAVMALLADPAVDHAKNVARLMEALEIRNEAFHNEYRSISLLRAQIVWIGLVVAAALITVWWVTIYRDSPLGSGDFIRVAMFFGLLGGALSVALSYGRRAQSRLPEQLRSDAVTLIRPILGAGAAVVVYVLWQAAGFDFIGPKNVWSVGTVAFLSGFSERWFLGVVERVGGSGE